MSVISFWCFEFANITLIEGYVLIDMFRFRGTWRWKHEYMYLAAAAFNAIEPDKVPWNGELILLRTMTPKYCICPSSMLVLPTRCLGLAGID